MNLKRGLFRLWLVLSICWVIWETLYLGPGEIVAGIASEPAPAALALLAVALLGPPAIMFVVGYGLLWALGGFRRDG